MMRWVIVLIVGVQLSGGSAWAQFGGVPKYDIKFEGGTFADYIKVVQKADGDLNVVLHDNVKNVSLPPIELRQVSSEGAVQTAALLADEPLDLERPVDTLGHTHIMLIRSSRNQIDAPLDSQLEVFGVKSLLDEVELEQLLSVFETALKLIPQHQRGAKEPEIKLHRETGILFVNASPSQLKVIRDIIVTLSPNPGYVFNTPNLFGPPKEESEDDTAELRKKLQALEEENRQLKTQLENQQTAE